MCGLRTPSSRPDALPGLAGAMPLPSSETGDWIQSGRQTGTGGGKKQRVELLEQGLGLGGIGTAGVDRRPHLAVEVSLDLELPAEAKPLVLQKESLVELGDQPLQIFQLAPARRIGVGTALGFPARVRSPFISEASTAAG